MINDSNTNFLYLADTLPIKFPKFYNEFSKILKQNKVDFELLPKTKDVWARDYMPVQNSLRQLINFQYDPDYLKNKKYTKLKTNPLHVCKALKLETVYSPIILDGGNIVHRGNKALFCDKLIYENKNVYLPILIETLRWTLRVNHVFFIPTPKDDLFGHADGILRFVNNTTVLINDFSKEDPEYRKLLIYALNQMKLNYIEIPYVVSQNKTIQSAQGVYINFLQMKGKIFLPIYDLMEDKQVIEIFRKYFPKTKIIPVNCNDIAKEGGALNCISWTISK
jgi:agmatine deiminase